jgi:hypothetical protein
MTNDANDALRVVEAMIGLGWHIAICDDQVEFYRWEGNKEIMYQQPMKSISELPLAICEAAAKVVDAQQGTVGE